ncbi:hypothetical protein XA68_18042 [Ophiocordyceps unilateralis]|uniref:Glycosyl transferase n=1 Tax=Ophiocordyceps unilateralis TaxID=268505 RepID=A0A2A9PIF0_OPHUN|nr:hypothetical protein XA68_18042 [Ophiocordyceps unilateralis]
MAPPPLKAIAAGFLVAVSLLYMLRLDETRFLSTAAGTKPSANKQDETIPNVVNLVYLMESERDNLAFEFSHFLSVYSAWHHLGPKSIYLHTNADASTIQRARWGQTGKWARLLLEIPGLQIRQVVSPNVTTREGGHDQVIRFAEHKSDFVRVEAARELGGLYIDFDVFVLRDLQPLRNAGFGAVVGREVTDQVNSGIFLTRPHGKLISQWAEDMPRLYDGGWVTHSNLALTNIAEKLVADAPGEVLIMERNAFAPGGWGNADYDHLWATHESNDTQDSSWQVDWSRTYMLHAFMPYRARHKVHGFHRLHPRYVLGRRSNFARALYPVVSLLHKEGVVDWNDTFDGLEA